MFHQLLLYHIYSAYGGGNRYPNNIPSGYGGATAYNRPGYTNPVPNAGYGGYPKCVIIMLYFLTFFLTLTLTRITLL